MGRAEPGRRRRAEMRTPPAWGAGPGAISLTHEGVGLGVHGGTLALGKSLPPALRSRVPGSQLPTSRKVR
jgi:hypothetical protein